MIFPLFILAAPIAIADISGRKIPNIYLFLLSMCLLPYLVIYGLGPLTPLLLFHISLLIMSFFGMGMGDVKLLAIIGSWLNSHGGAEHLVFVALILAISATHILYLTIKNGSIPNSIPMAPSIFLALSLYLAMR